MSTHAVPVVRHRASAATLVLALVASVAIVVLGVVDAPRAGSSEPRTIAPGAVPTPDWLQRYLDVEAPAVADAPAPADPAPGGRPLNPGLR